MKLETILNELRRRKRALEEAIAALESLKRGQSRTRKPRRTRAALAAGNTEQITNAKTQLTAVGKGRLLRLPTARRSRRRAEQVKA